MAKCASHMGDPHGNPETGAQHPDPHGLPKDSFEAIFCLARLFESSGVIFRDPPRICFKTSIKIASRGYFYHLRLFFASRGLFQKNSLKRVLGLGLFLVNRVFVPCQKVGHGEVRVYRGTGVSRGVRRTTWERSQ